MGKPRARRKPSAPGAAREPGHDGIRPEFRPARDLAGTGKRDRPDGPQNINTDRLEWLCAHGHIDDCQLLAGRRFQGDCEIAEISPGVSLVSSGGNGASSTLSDAQCMALSRINGVRRALAPSILRIIELVAIEGMSMNATAHALRLPTRSAIPLLQQSLDQLGKHYGMC